MTDTTTEAQHRTPMERATDWRFIGFDERALSPVHVIHKAEVNGEPFTAPISALHPIEVTQGRSEDGQMAETLLGFVVLADEVKWTSRGESEEYPDTIGGVPVLTPTYPERRWRTVEVEHPGRVVGTSYPIMAEDAAVTWLHVWVQVRSVAFNHEG